MTLAQRTRERFVKGFEVGRFCVQRVTAIDGMGVRLLLILMLT